METVRMDTIGGFNEFLKTQKAAPGEATFTLVQFDDQYEIVHDGINIKEVPELIAETFVPRGWTALLDAIGRTVNTTGARLAALSEDERPSKVIFLILTDGEENKSTEFTRAKINEMIKHQTEVYQWDFVFLGANQDAIKSGESMGIKAGNSMTYVADSQGTADAFFSVGVTMCAYRSGDATAKAAFFSDEDRVKQKRTETKLF
jgi:hypothetical protein